MDEQVYVKCSSHRARDKLFRLLGDKPKGYWSFDHGNHYGIFLIPADKLESAREITGVTKLRNTEGLMKCW
jgi:hypothetical protein